MGKLSLKCAYFSFCHQSLTLLGLDLGILLLKSFFSHISHFIFHLVENKACCSLIYDTQLTRYLWMSDSVRMHLDLNISIIKQQQQQKQKTTTLGAMFILYAMGIYPPPLGNMENTVWTLILNLDNLVCSLKS